MNKKAVNLDTYSLSLLTAKEDILNPRSSTNWAIFAYEGYTNKLKLADSGAGGVAELAGKFHISKPQYGLCKLGNTEAGGLRIAMISWVGQNVDDYRRTECASHIPAIKNFFKEAHVFISAEKVEDVTEEGIRAELNKAQASTSTQWVRRSSRSSDKEELVGTNYRKTNAAMEMRLINRESFWARAEREEEARKEEERKKTLEERRRLEKERILKERRDAEERDRKMNEKLQMIEEQRRKRAEQEEELRRKERLKWELQQREHEEDMRARLRRSESIEKAAEAAALVSQRSMNPREFFRQLSSSSSLSPTSPGSRTGKPLRRYQRSLTDTAFIFSKAEESAASSPRSSPLVSPFSRAPPSPIHRAMSPPFSPDFRPVTSPQRPRAPVSPPMSPSRPAPPVSALPSVPRAGSPVEAEPKPPSPAEPSAPPASPSLLVSLTSSLVKNNPPKTNPEALPASPPNTPTQPEDAPFGFDPVLAPQAPTAPLPERPQPNADFSAASHLNTELVSDVGYKVQAVLVEEDEEEDVEEQEENATETETQQCAMTADQDQEQEEEEKEEEQEEEEEEEEKVERVKEEEEEKEVEEEKTEEQLEEAEGEEDIKQEAEATSVESVVESVQESVEESVQESVEESVAESVEESVEVVQEDEAHHQPEDSQAFSEPAESTNTVVASDEELICHVIKEQTVQTNGMMNGEDTKRENGIERSLSPSDTEFSSPEVAVCYDVRLSGEEDEAEDNEQEISENGQEAFAERQMCVRALYDYQAEDESEISFEPGDIIRDVETVDKAWWRGWSKDGRQGLFPANYVETI